MKRLYKGQKDEYQLFRLSKSSGQGFQTKILYVGQAYYSNLSKRGLLYKKILSGFLTLFYFIFLILGGLPNTATNSSFWHIVPYVLSILFGLILAYGEFCFLTSTHIIYRAEWESYREHIKIGARMSAVSSCFTVIINLGLFLWNFKDIRSVSSELIYTILTIVSLSFAIICVLLLQKIESHSSYTIIPALEDSALDSTQALELAEEYERLQKKNNNRLKCYNNIYARTR